MAPKCTFSAITSDVAVLSDDSTTDEAKLAALKFLGHWVGDLHQPLHISFRDDRGGNSIKESGGPCSRNIHAVWDTCIIHEELIGFPRWNWRIRALATRMRDTVSSTNREDWNRNRVSTWANESFKITIAPETDYCDMRNGSCIYDIDTDREEYTDGEEQKRALINRDYIKSKAPVIEERLVRAGVRLAGLLNKSLDRQ